MSTTYTFNGSGVLTQNIVETTLMTILQTNITITGYTSISNSAFTKFKHLTTISSSSVITIEANAFQYLTALTSISLPSVTNIGASAFASCTALSSISLPSVTTIGASAFQYLTTLRSITLPLVTNIGASAFLKCPLRSITLPLVTTIGAYAFQDCTTLDSITLPLVTTIGAYAFYNCIPTSISLPLVTTIGRYAFHCRTLTSISIPSVITIGQDAFQRTALTLISIPESISTIERNAFYDCTALKKVYISTYAAGKIGIVSPATNITFFGARGVRTIPPGSTIQTVPSTPAIKINISYLLNQILSYKIGTIKVKYFVTTFLKNINDINYTNMINALNSAYLEFTTNGNLLNIKVCKTNGDVCYDSDSNNTYESLLINTIAPNQISDSVIVKAFKSPTDVAELQKVDSISSEVIKQRALCLKTSNRTLLGIFSISTSV